jgi:hypothetical protein
MPLVISISATDKEITTLPSNFYSIGLPDTSAVNTLIYFIQEHYPKVNIFITVAAESKESADFSQLLVDKYQEKFPAKTAIQRRFLTEDMSQIDMKEFLKGYHEGDVIVVMAAGEYSAIDLMNKISSYLNPYKPVFITSADNWGDERTPQIIVGNYDAFRIDTLSLQSDVKSYDIFRKNYKKIHGYYPKDKIAFITYQAVMSIVKAIKQFPVTHASSTRQSILLSYEKARQYDPDWFRAKEYIVYKIEPHREVYFETLRNND